MKDQKYSLNQANYEKIIKGAGIAVGGALLAYVVQVLGNTDFGAYNAIAAAVGAILINAGREYLKGA